VRTGNICKAMIQNRKKRLLARVLLAGLPLVFALSASYAVGEADGPPDAPGNLIVTCDGALDFRLQPAGSVLPDRRALHLSGGGTEPIAYRVTTEQAWIELSNDRGALAPGEPVRIDVKVDRNATERLAAGVHHGELHIENLSGGFGTLSLDVTLQVEGTGKLDRPGLHNTGPEPSVTLVRTETIVAKRDGQIIENVEVHGQIVIKANDVTVRNFRISANGALYGITVGLGEYSGTVIQNGEIAGASSAGIFGSNFTARRVQIHEIGGDGIKARDNVLVEGCWIHHVGTRAGAHADGNQTRMGKGITFRHNFIDMPFPTPEPGEKVYLANAAFMISDHVGPVDDFLIEGNWLNGGNYTIMLKVVKFGGPTNVRIVNNRFGRSYQYGLLRLSGVPVKLEGNVWDDTGELVPGQDAASR